MTFLFCIFIFPLSFDAGGGDGISANYSFILMPVIIIFVLGRRVLPSQNIRTIILLYVIIFILSSIYQLKYIQFIDRRIASFIIFISMFSYMFIRIDEQMVKSFKVAIVISAIIFALESMLRFFLLGGADLGSSAKGAVGSQRYGFVYVLVIWILYYYSSTHKLLSAAKYISMLVVGAGLVLTFSRSGIVALFGSIAIFMLANLISWFKRPKPPSITQLYTMGLIILSLAITVFVLYANFQLAFDFYGERLFSSSLANGEDAYDFKDKDASEGYRIYILQKIIDFIIFNPLTGSGYLGVWILFDDLSGSAHNQYLDVLFRTGLLGFMAYIYLLICLLKSFRIREPGLFWGLLGIMIYGIVHETFKLSHGSFILAFMLGMMVQYRSYKYHDYSNYLAKRFNN